MSISQLRNEGGPLLVIGAGGFGRETAMLVHALAAAGQPWALRGFLDDDVSLHGREIAGTRVLAGTDAVGEHPDCRVVVTIGSPRNYFVRKRLVDRLALPPDRYATLVHPQASISRDSSLGAGTVVLAGTVLTAGVRVGRHVVVMPNTVMTHDDEISDYVTFGAGVRLAGGVRVMTGAYVGSGAMVRENVAIGSWSLIGMGAVVLQDIPPATVWAGVPARRIRDFELPAVLRQAAASST